MRKNDTFEQRMSFLNIKRAVKILFFLSIIGAIGLVALFVYYTRELPRPEKFTELRVAQSTRIYDRTGEILLYEVYGEEKREILPLSAFPDSIKQAIIAAEDANFYSHFGLDFQGIVRAIIANIREGSRVQGASTISQQLIRNSLLTGTKTIDRKIKEIILTLEMERRYSKDEILELYLNQIPFGSNAYGVGVASQLYFQKIPEELTIAESALLAAMIPAPSRYSPYGSHKEALLERKDRVLNRMEQEGFISQELLEEAKNQKLVFADSGQILRAPHFSLLVLDELLFEYEESFLRENGLRVITTLDWELQLAAQDAIDSMAKQNEYFNAYNEALVALDPNTGEILAMVGSKDWFGDSFPEGCSSGVDCLFDPRFNITTSLPGRQPGSAFKPFVYLTAFEKGFDDNTIVIDEETNFGLWGDEEYIPKNYDERFRGPVTLRQGLGQSLNVPSVKVILELAGIQDSINTARAMGITTLKEDASFYGPSLVLGGGEVRLLDIVSAYGVFAAQGNKVPPFLINRIENADGEIIAETKKTAIRVVSQKATDLITDILSDNEVRSPVFGTYSALYIPGYDVAAKTGTTQEYKDAWTIGYTKDIVAGVWVGNSDNTPTSEKPGAVLAAPIWQRFMLKALPYLQSKP